MLLAYESLVLYAVFLIATIAVAGKTKNFEDLLRKIGFKKVDILKETSVAFVYAILMIATSICIAIISYSVGLGQDAEIVSNVIMQINIIEIITIIFTASFVEEMFFRGVIQKKTNIYIGAIAFAAIHAMYGSITELIGVFVLGLILGIEFERRKSLFAPVLSHLIYDLATVIMIFGA